MRLRLPDRGAFNYQIKRDNGVWPDHRLRTRITAEMIAWLAPGSVLDPACGDASIVRQANEIQPIPYALLGDISAPNVEALVAASPSPAWQYRVDDAVHTLTGAHGQGPDVFNLIVLTEFLEHVKDPVEVLRLARARGKMLIASSPLFSEGRTDDNPEHLWQFDAQGYEAMLELAGWEPFAYIPLYFESIYDFQIWAAR